MNAPCDALGDETWKSLYHMFCMDMVSLQCEYAYGSVTWQSPSYLLYTDLVFHLYVYACDTVDSTCYQNTSHTLGIDTASFHLSVVGIC